MPVSLRVDETEKSSLLSRSKNLLSNYPIRPCWIDCWKQDDDKKLVRYLSTHLQRLLTPHSRVPHSGVLSK